MRVQFTATFDEFVDASLRVITRGQRGAHPSRWLGLVVTSLGTGGLVTFAVIPAATVVAATAQMIWLIKQRPLTRRTGETE